MAMDDYVYRVSHIIRHVLFFFDVGKEGGALFSGDASYSVTENSISDCICDELNFAYSMMVAVFARFMFLW